MRVKCADRCMPNIIIIQPAKLCEVHDLAVTLSYTSSVVLYFEGMTLSADIPLPQNYSFLMSNSWVLKMPLPSGSGPETPGAWSESCPHAILQLQGAGQAQRASWPDVLASWWRRRRLCVQFENLVHILRGARPPWLLCPCPAHKVHHVYTGSEMYALEIQMNGSIL